MSNVVRTLAYSECDTYDSESDYHFRSRPWLSRYSFKSKKYRRELKLEICELLVTFAEHSRHGSTISCRYISHAITGGLIIYIPFVRTKLKTGSLPVDLERTHEMDRKRTNHKFRHLPDATLYFQLRNAKIDVSYARMVKKPPVQNSVVEKEEMWGSRYPNKRYMMNDSIRYSIFSVLNIILDKFKSSFVTELISDEHTNKLLFGLKSIAENLNPNQFVTLQHVLYEFGKFFHDGALVFAFNPRLRNKISRLEIEFENLLEIHLGEWNTK